MGWFYSEVELQKREAEGTVRTKHQLNLDPNPEGTQKTLGARRYGGREEQRIPRVGESAGAAQGVPCVGLLSSAEFLFLGSVRFLVLSPAPPHAHVKLKKKSNQNCNNEE